MKYPSKKEWEELRRKDRLLRDAARVLNVEGEDLPRVIDRFLSETEKMRKRNSSR